MAFDVSNYYIDNMVKNNVEHVTETEVQAINNLTMGQSSNPNWTEMRKGRITASNFYAVHTKVESYKRNAAHCDIKPLLSRIMGYKYVNPNVMSLKYGQEMEPIAKIEFLKMYRKKHKEVSFDECGIFLDVDHPYLAASPDLLVSCSCCGEGLVEFKCPLIPKCSTCFSFCKCNLPSCLQNTESLTLKHGGHIMVKFRARLNLQSDNGVYCTYIHAMDHFMKILYLTSIFIQKCHPTLNFSIIHLFYQRFILGLCNIF